MQSWDCSHRRSLGISHTLSTTSTLCLCSGCPSDASPSILNRLRCVSPLLPQPPLMPPPVLHPVFLLTLDGNSCVFLQKRGFSEILKGTDGYHGTVCRGNLCWMNLASPSLAPAPIASQTLTTKRGGEMAGDSRAFIPGHSTTLPSRPHGMPTFTSSLAHQDRRTCLLQGPFLCICVLAVLLIKRRQQETTHHSLQALSPALRPRAHPEATLRKREGQPRK